ncbi:Zinc finger CCCH domain-containing protein 32, partial [Linum perenne]
QYLKEEIKKKQSSEKKTKTDRILVQSEVGILRERERVKSAHKLITLDCFSALNQHHSSTSPLLLLLRSFPTLPLAVFPPDRPTTGDPLSLLFAATVTGFRIGRSFPFHRLHHHHHHLAVVECTESMELYSHHNQAVNASQSAQQQTEWTPTGPETGLEESMWRLGLTSNESYPERLGVPNCVYYMRTGFCGYGARCRYNHPRDRAAVEEAVRATGLYPERAGEPQCQFYLKTGTCKFGASCKFHHPKHRGGSLSNASLNTHGYPLRPGETECSYYLQTGHCKFGLNCKFHHPQPADTSTTAASAPQFYQQYGGTSTSLRVRPPILPGPGSYMQGTYGPVLFPPGVVPIPGWSPYSAPVSPVLSPGAQTAVAATSLYGVTQLSTTSPGPSRPYPSLLSFGSPSSSTQKEPKFPERPGELECQYYLRTGDCKYGSSCRYHHPRDRAVPVTDSVLNPLGLPLRPGTQPCSFYMQNGYCKFGSTCKFDHPMGGAVGYNPSASSLVDIPPVAPYLAGSLLATLSPSSPSYELRPQLISSTPNTSSSSVGLILSQTGSIPFTDLQLSSQTSLPSSSSRSSRQGIEMRRSF